LVGGGEKIKNNPEYTVKPRKVGSVRNDMDQRCTRKKEESWREQEKIQMASLPKSYSQCSYYKVDALPKVFRSG
jgi:hypothetical protein